MDNRITVLVIEDNYLNLKLVRTILALEGVEILEATDAEHGLELCAQRRPDIVLMDIQLPGMDGLQATGIIKGDDRLRHIPVVALTSHAMEGDDKRAYDAGCDGYISKPIDTDTFFTTLTGFLKEGTEKGKAVLADEPSIPAVSNRPLDRRQYMKRILIVDDEPLNLKLLCGALASQKYELITARDGMEALEKVEGYRPDLILLDIMMPRMNGFDVTKRLKGDPETEMIPIILITALSNNEDKVKGLEAGADEFLNKPVNTGELLARVQSLLRMKEYAERLTTGCAAEQSFQDVRQEKVTGAQSGPHPNVLLVENNELDIRHMKARLEKEPYHLLLAPSGEEALALVKAQPVDCIISDILLPGMDGFSLCEELRRNESYKHIQIVALTRLEEVTFKVKGLEVGFDDYLVKPVDFQELKARIRTMLRKKAYLDQLLNKYQTAFQQAITDRMTGLYNQAYFKHFLEVDIRRAKRQGYPISVIMADLDDFKSYNDQLGHMAGDAILKEAARIIEKNIRIVDVASRYGGDEFAVVLPYADFKSALSITERIRKAFQRHVFPTCKGHGPVHPTISTGIATYPHDASTADSLIKAADTGLYMSKGSGKDCSSTAACGRREPGGIKIAG